jgi:hypothetical protein
MTAYSVYYLWGFSLCEYPLACGSGNDNYPLVMEEIIPPHWLTL